MGADVGGVVGDGRVVVVGGGGGGGRVVVVSLSLLLFC